MGARATGHNRLLLPALCAASALSVTNALALSPFLAEIGDDFDTPVALLGQSLTVAGLLGATLGLFIGPLAERTGYRRVLLLGTLALMTSNLVMAAATGFPMLLLAQVANGVAGATITPMAFAYAGVLYGAAGRGRAISRIYATAAGAEVVVLPLLTVVADSASWRWAFALLSLAAVGFFALALAALPVRDTDPTARLSPRAVVAAYLPILREPPLALLYAAQFLRGVCWTGMLAYIGAFINDELGYSLRLSGLVWVVLGPGFLIGSLLAGGRLRRHDPRRGFIVMTLLLAVPIAFTFWLEAPLVPTYALLLAVATVGGAAEVIAATAISSETTAPQGPTMALHSSTLRYGTATGALVGGGLLAVGGYTALGAGLPLLGVAAVLCAWRSGRVAAPGAAGTAQAQVQAGPIMPVPVAAGQREDTE